MFAPGGGRWSVCRHASVSNERDTGERSGAVREPCAERSGSVREPCAPYAGGFSPPLSDTKKAARARLAARASGRLPFFSHWRLVEISECVNPAFRPLLCSQNIFKNFSTRQRVEIFF